MINKNKEHAYILIGSTCQAKVFPQRGKEMLDFNYFCKHCLRVYQSFVPVTVVTVQVVDTL